MNSILLFVFGAVFFLLLAMVQLFVRGKFTAGKGVSPFGEYELQSALLTPAERSFAGALEGALPEGTVWFAKVRLGDVFKPRRGLTASERTRALNRINQKHVDFLLVRGSDLVPVAGIELDDRSHQQTRRKERDAFVDDVFARCELPLLHVTAESAYNVVELRTKITVALTKT